MPLPSRRPSSLPSVVTSGVFVVLLFLSLFIRGTVFSAPAEATITTPRRTVVWISLDGVRSDYLDRGRLPFFDRLRAEAAWSRRLRPAFPPVTFPNHCAQATGVPVERHGVTGNVFFDAATRREARYPTEAVLLQAEPIWLTAARQGVRTLVFDWPLSQNQPGPVRATYLETTFDLGPTDDQRLDRLLDVWRRDIAAASPPSEPLRLLMGYIRATDPTGHALGPDAPEITAAMEALDHRLARFFDAALTRWGESNSAKHNGEFVLLLTTDHGMSRVDKLVNLEKCLGLSSRPPSAANPSDPAEPVVLASGNLGHIFLPAGVVGTDAAATTLAAWEERLRAFSFLQVFRRETLPTAWGYRHPTRTGDLVVLCRPGYSFDGLAAAPVVDTGPGRLRGMHGYPVEEDPEMYGPCFLWRSGGNHGGGHDLGEVRWDQLHPTVARLLGICPAEGAAGEALD